MTLRWLALALAAVLAVPTTALILRAAWRDRDTSRSAPARAVEALWIAVPVALLAALVALSATAAA